jgi:hypothetical protein
MLRCNVWRGVVIATFVLTVGGCAPLPERFARVDGRVPDQKQLLSDEAICRDEIKDNLSTANQKTIWGPTEDAIAVYTVCMTQKGYRADSPRE